MADDIDIENAKMELERKINEDAENAIKAVYEELGILPAWFVPRMMYDTWRFGLMMVTGVTIGIEQIRNVRRDATGNIWFDVELLGKNPTYQMSQGTFFVAPTSRTTASINASHVMAAFELADT